MTGEPLPGGPEILELTSVPGFVVFDLPGAAQSAGGTRLAPDVSAAEVALLARAMTYKFAALGAQTGGAKAGVRGDPSDRPAKAALMARFCAEIAPLTDSGRPNGNLGCDHRTPQRPVLRGPPDSSGRPGPDSRGGAPGPSSQNWQPDTAAFMAGLAVDAVRASRAESVPGGRA